MVISPELADVLGAVIARIRDDNGVVPPVLAYDYHERVWNPPDAAAVPAPLRRGEPADRRASGSRAAQPGPGRHRVTDASGKPLRFVPHDFRRIFVTDAVMNGMPPHIAQLVAGHRDITVTMGYKAVYPEEVINAHRAFIARRRALRPAEEYRTPTDAEWEEFLGHFERRKVSTGTCGRAFGTPCIHEHACIRCSMLWPDPAQRERLVEIRDNLTARIAEAQREGWLGDVEGLQISLDGANHKLAQVERRSPHPAAVDLGIPALTTRP